MAAIQDMLSKANWQPVEKHLDEIVIRIDESIDKTSKLRKQYRTELLSNKPELLNKIQRPSQKALDAAIELIKHGSLAASDGTVAPVPLLGGTKIQVGVVIVFNTGEVVNWVTRVFETELIEESKTAEDYFLKLRESRKISNLLARAIMLYGERKELLKQSTNWRMIHGELIPFELRTGAGDPRKNLQIMFDLVNDYIKTENFIAVSESSNDIDILNAAILLESGEYIVLKSLEQELNFFLDGDKNIGVSGANFEEKDKQKFRNFISSAGKEVSIILAKAGNQPYLIECCSNKIDEAVALFFADALWTRGYDLQNPENSMVRGFPYHIDLADQVCRTLLKGADFYKIVESRLFNNDIETGIFELNPRNTRS